jgi:uncharacterized surface protein with fasciclin (FAS1) repeats
MNIFVRKVVPAVVAATLACAAMAMPASAAKPKWADKSEDDIVTFAVEASGGEVGAFDNNGGDFDILVAALVETGTIAIFNGTDYTVFAPTDQAFYDLTGTEDDQAALAVVTELLDRDQLIAVLSYHVTEGVRNSRTVTRSKQIKMLDKNTISGRTGLIEANFSIAEILNADNRLADGMVHVIDTVLLPIDPSSL